MEERDLKLHQRRQQRRRNELIVKCIISLLVLIVVVLVVILIKDVAVPQLTGKNKKEPRNYLEQLQGSSMSAGGQVSDGTAGNVPAAVGTEAELIAKADRMAMQYDYDGAISYLKSAEGYTASQNLQNAVAGYENTKSSCSSYPLDQITHVFFHTMIRDNSKAFDGDSKEGGYNQVMTTMSEFAGIMQSMYEKGYVMVSLHDMCTVNSDGTVTRGEIRLPPGKTPFVLSQDDVSYYHYMDGDGFAQKLIVDENGDVKNTYIEDDGSISVGDYDMVPWIDTFVKEHPDFDEAAWQNEVSEAQKVAEAMKANGWEFASHTWGHISPQATGIDGVMKDTERWLNNVAAVVGDTDVIIFAFGADIGGWQPYTSDNPYFSYLKEKGFNIYCNVDSSKNWVQFGDNYMRQGRRNLDGYRMYYNPEMLSDLFDVSSVWDNARPTPVPEM